MSKPYKPGAVHPYDNGREALRATGNTLFGVKMLTPMDVQGNGTKNKASTYTWMEVGFPKQRYVRIAYDTGWIVHVPVESDEEIERLAQVFMDLMNSKT